MVEESKEKNIAILAEVSSPPANLAHVRTHLQVSTGLNDEQIEHILVVACLSIKNNLAKARQALDACDYPSFSRAAHSLKGILLQCGLHDLAVQAEAIDYGIRKTSTLPYGPMLEQLAVDLAGLCQRSRSLKQ